MNAVYRTGRRLLTDTPLESIASRAYWHFNTSRRRERPIEHYRVTGLPEAFESFLIAMDKPQNQVLEGTYERPVMEALADLVSPRTTVWEIGARWGYYSLAAATAAESVVAAEADPMRCSLIHASRYANGFDNLGVIGKRAGADYQLDEFAPPDVAIIDVEGDEAEVLDGAGRWLDAGTTFLVEIHGREDQVTARRVRQTFADAGYTIDVLEEWTEINRNVIARPEGSA